MGVIQDARSDPGDQDADASPQARDRPDKYTTTVNSMENNAPLGA